jgi:hypothetical protein
MVYEIYVTPETLGMIWALLSRLAASGPVELADILLAA